jgi:signal transduction histidine kinase/CheY-like chemotaxis protein
MSSATNVRLRREIVLSGMAAVVIPFCITGVVLYVMLSKSLLDIYRERATQMAKGVCTLIDGTLRQQLQMVKVFAGDPAAQEAVATGDYSVARAELRAHFASMGGPSMAFFIADRAGTIRADSTFDDQLGISIADRPYFRQGRAGRTSIYGPIHARAPAGSGRESQAIVLVTAPISTPGGFGGIVAAAIEIKHLVDTVGSTRIGKTGYAFVTDATGLIIVHPRPEYILDVNLNSEPGMQEIARRMTRRETGAEGYIFRGTRKIAGFAPMETAGWSAAFTQDYAEIVAPVNRVLFFVFASGIIFVAVAFTITLVLSRRVSTPVERMIALLQKITAHSGDLIVSIGLDRRITYANPAAEKAAGGGTLVGTEPIVTNPHGPPAEDIWKTLQGGKTWTGLVQPAARTADPPTFTVMILPVLGATGQVESYLEIGKDVTKELTLESRLRQAQKMEALGAMAGGIAHDFNNILSGIYGYSELCIAAAETREQVEEYVGEILRAAERARDLIRQILTFSRQTALEVKAVVPRYITNEAVKLMRASVRSAIEIQTSLESDSIVMAEPAQIHQIIANLCSNAVAAIGDRPGRIEVGLQDVEVDGETARLHPGLKPGPHVRMRVSDTGTGIDPAIIDRIFDPFFTTKPQGQGTGLGLSVVHGIVRQLDGAISVYSEPGRGTSFTVFLPIAANAAAEVSAPTAIPAPGTERVLLVDDEPAIIRTICAGLTGLGYSSVCYTDSNEALEAFAAHPSDFDIVVTDHLMPRMTGLQMAAGMREHRPTVPVIITSGFPSAELGREAERLGFQGLLAKPLNLYQIAAAIRQALDRQAGEGAEPAERTGKAKGPSAG